MLTGYRKDTENIVSAIDNKPIPPKRRYKYTIISYLFNSSEHLNEVKCASSDVRYLLITNNTRLKSKTWEIHQYTEYQCLSSLTDVLSVIYYIKYHPFEFCDTNVCFTVDSNICILKSLDKLYDDFTHSSSDYGLSVHPYRTNIYDELSFCHNANAITTLEVQSQKHLFGKTFFNKVVLFQSNIILRKKGKVSDAIDGLTWNFLKLTSTDADVSMLDHTILTYVIATYMSNSKYFIFSQDLMVSSYIKCINSHTHDYVTIDKKYLVPPAIFGKKITPYRIE